FAGNKIVYAAVRDVAAANTGWLTRGTWSVPSASTAQIGMQSYSPASGSGASGTFTAVFRHATASANITNVQILINRDLNGSNACYLTYVRSANQLYLVGNGGPTAPLLGPIAPNSGSGSMANAQCRVTGATVSSTATGLTLTVSITFLSGFQGAELVAHVAAQKYVGPAVAENSGWQAAGIWTVP
ncbi:MAG: hypothetical protein R2762_27315, partial [Bryobacteraceae bacterium]